MSETYKSKAELEAEIVELKENNEALKKETKALLEKIKNLSKSSDSNKKVVHVTDIPFIKDSLKK